MSILTAHSPPTADGMSTTALQSSHSLQPLQLVHFEIAPTVSLYSSYSPLQTALQSTSIVSSSPPTALQFYVRMSTYSPTVHSTALQSTAALHHLHSPKVHLQLLQSTSQSLMSDVSIQAHSHSLVPTVHYSPLQSTLQPLQSTYSPASPPTALQSTYSSYSPLTALSLDGDVNLQPSVHSAYSP
ncbi:hypothetical protein AVEN_19361-1 [Araneus ventricosus]|uniref:Uncharacterized protein n=1 Tax=Araneus ventricosus TaxID=182803 RepID=A0A4Y2T715_ARAVE|nr:hypothetical protein AVEN_19361-1 [Araneus ventricosus]